MSLQTVDALLDALSDALKSEEKMMPDPAYVSSGYKPEPGSIESLESMDAFSDSAESGSESDSGSELDDLSPEDLPFPKKSEETGAPESGNPRVALVYRDFLGNKIFDNTKNQYELMTFRNGFQVLRNLKTKFIQKIMYPNGKVANDKDDSGYFHFDGTIAYFIPTGPKKRLRPMSMDETDDIIVVILGPEGHLRGIQLRPDRYLSVSSKRDTIEFTGVHVSGEFRVYYVYDLNVENDEYKRIVPKTKLPGIKAIVRDTNQMDRIELDNSGYLVFSSGRPLLFSLANKEKWFFDYDGCLNNIVFGDGKQIYFHGDNRVDCMYTPVLRPGELKSKVPIDSLSRVWKITVYDDLGNVMHEESGLRGHRYSRRDFSTY